MFLAIPLGQLESPCERYGHRRPRRFRLRALKGRLVFGKHPIEVGGVVEDVQRVQCVRLDGRPSRGHPSRSRSGKIDAQSTAHSLRRRAGAPGREAFGRATPILPPRPRLYLHLMQPRPPQTRRRSPRP